MTEAIAMRTAIIVDDHKDTADMLTMVLETSGYKAVQFLNFDSAMGAIHSHDPCIALIDYNIRGGQMSLENFVIAIRKQRMDIKIVIVTGDARAVTHSSELNVDCLMKPVEPAKILALVQKHCDDSAN
jgi:DNA-binding NtrC family response regulator